MARRVALALALALLASGAQAQTRRALVVGIDDYGGAEASASAPPFASLESKGGGRRRGSWGNLDGAVNDALAVRDVLVRRLGFAPEHVTVLTNREATRDAIVATFRRVLVAEAAPGDVAFFYYAGHGSQVLNTLSPEPDGLDETLVPADTRAGAPDLRDKELAALFVEAAARTRLTVVLDSCHSGGAMRGVGKLRSIPADRSRDLRDPEPGPRPEDHGVLVMTAALDSQPAGEARDDAGRPHGAFTTALLAALARASGEPSAEELFASAKAAMQRGSGGQEPVLYAPPERRREPLLGFGGRARAGLRVAVARALPEARTFLVEGGLAHQLGPGTVLRGTGRAPLRLVLREVTSASASVAVVVEGDPSSLRPGDLLEVERHVPPPSSRLRAWLPPAPGGSRAAALAARLAAAVGPGAADASVEIVASAETADYALEVGEASVAWRRRDGAAEALPARAPAIPLGDPDRAAVALAEQARRLARVRAWLTLASAPGERAFPYRLAVEATDGSGPLPPRAPVRPGAVLALSLVRDEAAAAAAWQPHYVYVLSLDGEGAIRLVYPRRGAAVENRLPVLPPTATSIRPPERIPLGRITLLEPSGLETLVLLASRESIPALDALEQPGLGEAGSGGALPAVAEARGSRGERAEAAWVVQRVELVGSP